MGYYFLDFVCCLTEVSGSPTAPFPGLSQADFSLPSTELSTVAAEESDSIRR